MPMGIVSDSDFDIERTKLGYVPNKPNEEKEAEVKDIQKGRGEGKKEVPEVIREIVAKAAINGEGTGEAIASAFGVSESSVSAYKHGVTSTASYNEPPDPKLISSITSHKERISRKSRKILISALNSITPDKLEGTKAIDLSTIAKNMAAIVSDMEPKVIQENSGNNVNFVFMAPRVRSLNDFDIIDVSE